MKQFTCDFPGCTATSKSMKRIEWVPHGDWFLYMFPITGNLNCFANLVSNSLGRARYLCDEHYRVIFEKEKVVVRGLDR